MALKQQHLFTLQTQLFRLSGVNITASYFCVLSSFRVFAVRIGNAAQSNAIRPRSPLVVGALADTLIPVQLYYTFPWP